MLLSEEATRVQMGLDGFQSSGCLLQDETVPEESQLEFGLPTLTVPDQDRMKRIWDAWEQKGQEGLGAALDEAWEKDRQ